jgi:hypothetical protein
MAKKLCQYKYFILLNCLYWYANIYRSVSFPVVHHLVAFSRHSCRFTASSDINFLSFITLSTSLSHFTSGCPRHLLPSGDQVIIRLGHLFASMRTTCPYHSIML